MEGSEKGKNEEGKGWRYEINYCFFGFNWPFMLVFNNQVYLRENMEVQNGFNRHTIYVTVLKWTQ